jgi:hypothetical protein
MERHSKIANVGFIMTDWNPFPRLYHILGRGLLLTAHLFLRSDLHQIVQGSKSLEESLSLF